ASWHEQHRRLAPRTVAVKASATAEGPCERTASRSTAVTASRIQYHYRLCFLCLLQRASRTIRRRRRSLLCERRWRRSKVEDRGDGIGTHGGDSITVQNHRRGSSLGHFPPSTPASTAAAEELRRRSPSSSSELSLSQRLSLSPQIMVTQQDPRLSLLHPRRR
ncbi:hypothetical protein PIB30_090181, partial [Stylosanthes scabra]|nr:hypothetical protein [Stylosanthes scabra]